MRDFKDHPTKHIIREKWCKPLLYQIYKKLGYKLVYLGLPSIQALDILSWLEYLDKVIAFQCRKYPEPSHPNQPKDNIYKLNSILSELEKRGAIRTYSLFDGYIEEVVLRGLDNSGSIFSQNDVVTVYNLDFCNSITVPAPIVDGFGNIVTKNYKLDAICKLLEYQRDVSSNGYSKKFIMFLTVHSLFWKSEVEKLIGRIDSDTFRSYIWDLTELYSKEKISEQDKNIRLLKLYIFHVLKNHFCDREFIPEFLPPIYYQGYGKEWLTTFTIVGTFHKTPAASAPFFQDTNNFLKNKFLFANKKDIRCLNTTNIQETPIDPHSVKLFCETNSYKNFW